MNSDIRFTRRAYTAFDVDLKMIRLRDPLCKIVTTPAVYNRGKISHECFQTLNRMATIRDGQVISIKDLKTRSLFPTVQGLEEVENKYGETVSLYDMEGQHHKKKTRSQVTRQMYDLMNTMRGEDGKKVSKKNTILASKIRKRLVETAKRSRIKLKAHTDMSNEEFERHLLNRKPKDFIHARNRVASRMKRLIHDRRVKEDEKRQREPPVYIYGSQKLSSVANQMDRLRDEIAKDNMATYVLRRISEVVDHSSSSPVSSLLTHARTHSLHHSHSQQVHIQSRLCWRYTCTDQSCRRTS